mgnify:CR=1 FL=1
MGNGRDDERKNRLAAALRENLKRRKQQAKGRAGGAEEEPAGRDARPETDQAAPAKETAEKPR